MYEFNNSNIHLLEPILSESNFYVESLPLQYREGEVIWKISRPSWEKKQTKRIFFLHATIIPFVESVLILNGVKDIIYNWRNDVYSNKDSQHTFIEIEPVVKDNLIRIDTAFLETKIYFKKNIKVSIKDVSGGLEDNSLKIAGQSKFNFERWREEYQETLNMGE